jgi:hypothetical protein
MLGLYLLHPGQPLSKFPRTPLNVQHEALEHSGSALELQRRALELQHEPLEQQHHVLELPQSSLNV